MSEKNVKTLMYRCNVKTQSRAREVAQKFEEAQKSGYTGTVPEFYKEYRAQISGQEPAAPAAKQSDLWSTMAEFVRPQPLTLNVRQSESPVKFTTPELAILSQDKPKKVAGANAATRVDQMPVPVLPPERGSKTAKPAPSAAISDEEEEEVVAGDMDDLEAEFENFAESLKKEVAESPEFQEATKKAVAEARAKGLDEKAIEKLKSEEVKKGLVARAWNRALSDAKGVGDILTPDGLLDSDTIANIMASVSQDVFPQLVEAMEIMQTFVARASKELVALARPLMETLNDMVIKAAKEGGKFVMEDVLPAISAIVGDIIERVVRLVVSVVVDAIVTAVRTAITGNKAPEGIDSLAGSQKMIDPYSCFMETFEHPEVKEMLQQNRGREFDNGFLVFKEGQDMQHMQIVRDNFHSAARWLGKEKFNRKFLEHNFKLSLMQELGMGMSDEKRIKVGNSLQEALQLAMKDRRFAMNMEEGQEGEKGSAEWEETSEEAASAAEDAGLVGDEERRVARAASTMLVPPPAPAAAAAATTAPPPAPPAPALSPALLAMLEKSTTPSGVAHTPGVQQQNKQLSALANMTLQPSTIDTIDQRRAASTLLQNAGVLAGQEQVQDDVMLQAQLAEVQKMKREVDEYKQQLAALKQAGGGGSSSAGGNALQALLAAAAASPQVRQQSAAAVPSLSTMMAASSQPALTASQQQQAQQNLVMSTLMGLLMNTPAGKENPQVAQNLSTLFAQQNTAPIMQRVARKIDLPDPDDEEDDSDDERDDDSLDEFEGLDVAKTAKNASGMSKMQQAQTGIFSVLSGAGRQVAKDLSSDEAQGLFKATTETLGSSVAAGASSLGDSATTALEEKMRKRQERKADPEYQKQQAEKKEQKKVKKEEKKKATQEKKAEKKKATDEKKAEKKKATDEKKAQKKAQKEEKKKAKAAKPKTKKKISRPKFRKSKGGYFEYEDSLTEQEEYLWPTGSHLTHRPHYNNHFDNFSQAAQNHAAEESLEEAIQNGNYTQFGDDQYGESLDYMFHDPDFVDVVSGHHGPDAGYEVGPFRIWYEEKRGAHDPMGDLLKVRSAYLSNPTFQRLAISNMLGGFFKGRKGKKAGRGITDFYDEVEEGSVEDGQKFAKETAKWVFRLIFEWSEDEFKDKKKKNDKILFFGYLIRICITTLKELALYEVVDQSTVAKSFPMLAEGDKRIQKLMQKVIEIVDKLNAGDIEEFKGEKRLKSKGELPKGELPAAPVKPFSVSGKIPAHPHMGQKAPERMHVRGWFSGLMSDADKKEIEQEVLTETERLKKENSLEWRLKEEIQKAAQRDGKMRTGNYAKVFAKNVRAAAVPSYLDRDGDGVTSNWDGPVERRVSGMFYLFYYLAAAVFSVADVSIAENVVIYMRDELAVPVLPNADFYLEFLNKTSSLNIRPPSLTQEKKSIGSKMPEQNQQRLVAHAQEVMRHAEEAMQGPNARPVPKEVLVVVPNHPLLAEKMLNDERFLHNLTALRKSKPGTRNYPGIHSLGVFGSTTNSKVDQAALLPDSTLRVSGKWQMSVLGSRRMPVKVLHTVDNKETKERIKILQVV